MIRVLLLGVGGNVSQGILKAIRRSDLDVWVLGACISPLSSGLYMCDAAVVSPYANEDSFISWVIATCNEHRIDIIFTGVEENIIALAQAQERLEKETKAVFITSAYDMLVIGQDKLMTCEWLKTHGCNYPKYSEFSAMVSRNMLVERVGFPFILKPRNGKSSSGVFMVRNAEELAQYEGIKNYVVEECIGTSDEEYTVGCYCDKQGNLMDIIIMKRKLRSGTTVYAKVVEDEVIRAEAEKICKAFRPNGPLNIQLRKREDGTPIPFELNVRFSGSTAMRSMFGYEDVKAMMKEYILGEPIDDCFHVRGGEAFRYDAEMYVFDDATEVMTANGRVDDLLKRRSEGNIEL